MSKKFRDLLDQKNLKKEELKAALTEKRIDDAEKISNEVEILDREINLQSKLDAMEDDDVPNRGIEGKSVNAKVKYDGELFCKAVADALLRNQNKQGLKLTSEQQAKITENVGEDGGFAVPEDVSVKVNERLKEILDLSTLVDGEKVYTRKGQRTYEKRSAQTALLNLDEYDTTGTNTDAVIKEVSAPKLERMTFNLHDFAGMVTIPNDLLQFASNELEAFIINWLVDKVRFTRNTKILYGVGGAADTQGILAVGAGYTSVGLKATATIKDFKKLKNVSLMSVFKKTAKWVVNQDGFNFLDSLEDATGRPYLQPNPKDATQYMFLGLEVVEIGNEVMETKTGVAPIILGDLKEAYKIFYDGNYSMLTTNIGAGAFETNTTKTRVITKLDGNVKDKNAIVIANLTLPVEV